MSSLLTERDAYINEILYYIDNYKDKSRKKELGVSQIYIDHLKNLKEEQIYHINKNIYTWCNELDLTIFKDMIYIKDAFKILGVNNEFLIKHSRKFFDIYVPKIFKNESSAKKMRHAHLYNEKIAEVLQDKNKVLNYIGIANEPNTKNIEKELKYYDDILAIPSKVSKKHIFFGIYNI